MSNMTRAEWTKALLDHQRSEYSNEYSNHYHISGNTTSNTSGAVDITTTTTTNTTGGQWYPGKHWSYQDGYPWQRSPKPLPDSPSTPFPPPVIKEVLVMECPKCEKIKRVDTEWTEGDYICKECRGY